MRAVNLLPRDAGRTRSGIGPRLPLGVLVGGLVAVTVLFGSLVLSASGASDERRAELALTESAIAAIPRRQSSGAASSLVAQERADRVAALSAALSTRVPVDRVLYQLSYVLPEGVWLNGLVANAPSEDGGAPAASGGASGPASSGAAGVTIQGAAFSHESVARLLARLSLLPTLENVRLTASARVTPQTQGGEAKTKVKKQRPLVTFTISADLPTGAQS